MADPAYAVTLNAGEATPSTVTLRYAPSPLAAVTFVVITLFAGEATPSTVTLHGAFSPPTTDPTTLLPATVAQLSAAALIPLDVIRT